MEEKSLDGTPVFGLLKRIDNRTVGREAALLASYLGAQSVADIVRYSREQLEKMDVSARTLNVIERVLERQYHASFSKQPYEPARRAPETKERKSIARAGGASPLGVYQSRSI